MKIENVEIIEMALLLVFVILMAACTVCVLTEHIMAGLIAFMGMVVVGAAMSTPAIEYVDVEYYYAEEEELD